MTQARNKSESGFAMLVVFLMAAFVAIGLYMEMPRVVFESQRNREQALIDRGEQYRRAIQLYYRRYSRYPPDMKALENTDNRRFLRQRYKDPMTEKDEWRLVHAIGPGVFPDSLVHKTPGQKDKAEETTTTASAEAAPSPWMQRRPSDVTLPSSGAMAGDSTEPSMNNPSDPATQPADQPPAEADPPEPEQPTQLPAALPGFAPGQPGMVPGPNPGGAPGATGQQGLPAGFMMPGSQQAAQPGVGATGVPSIPGMPVVPSLVPGGPPTAGSSPTQPPAPGQLPGTAGNPALDLIRRMLTTPNPRGLQGVPTAPTAQQQPATPMLAGVASNLEADSIKVYNDRTKYHEWEFLYDPRTDRSAMARGPTGQVPTPQPSGPGGTGPNPTMGPGGMMPPATGPGGMTPMPQSPGRDRRVR